MSKKKAPRCNEYGLTDAVERFCQEIVNGATQAAAYRKAYPKRKWKDSAIHSCASTLMTDPKVYQRVRRLRKDMADKQIMTRAEILKLYQKMATFDIRKLYDDNGKLKNIADLDEETARLLNGIEAKSIGNITQTTKVKLTDKRGALDSMARMQGFAEDPGKDKPIQVETHIHISSEAIDERIKEIADKIAKKYKK